MTDKIFKTEKSGGPKKPIFEILLLVFSFIICTSFYREGSRSDRLQAYMMPPPIVEHLNLGYRYVLADSLWIRSLQDFMYCENKIAKNQCQGEGWLFKMLDLTGKLSPDFRNVFAIGGIVLSVVVSDIEGATKIFDRAVEIYSDDWEILYRAAYHANQEEKNPAKAAPLFHRAAEAGAPPWLYELSLKLYTEDGQREIALKIYEDMKKKGLDEVILERMRAKLGIKEPGK